MEVITIIAMLMERNKRRGGKVEDERSKKSNERRELGTAAMESIEEDSTGIEKKRK
jgi:hypothetical protein